MTKAAWVAVGGGAAIVGAKLLAVVFPWWVVPVVLTGWGVYLAKTGKV